MLILRFLSRAIFSFHVHLFPLFSHFSRPLLFFTGTFVSFFTFFCRHAVFCFRKGYSIFIQKQSIWVKKFQLLETFLRTIFFYGYFSKVFCLVSRAPFFSQAIFSLFSRLQISFLREEKNALKKLGYCQKNCRE